MKCDWLVCGHVTDRSWVTSGIMLDVYTFGFGQIYTHEYYLYMCPCLLVLELYVCYKVTSVFIRHISAKLVSEKGIGL